MLSRPRMCEGGVMICMRSVDVMPSAVAPVTDRGREGAVGVADRLGHSRGARAEHEHRIGRGIGCVELAQSRRDGFVEVQHRHHVGQHRVVADRVRRLRSAPARARPRRASTTCSSAPRRRRAPRSPAARRRIRGGWTTSARRGRLRAPRAVRASWPARWSARRVRIGCTAGPRMPTGRAQSPSTPPGCSLAGRPG